MDQSLVIEPINVAGAAILIEFCVLAILILGISMANTGLTGTDKSNNINYRDNHLSPLKMTSVGIAFLLVFPALFISESFFEIWGPLFQGVGINTISTHTAILFVFIVNIIIVSYLIILSGGVQRSPFTAVLFMLPALAIFLRSRAYVFIVCAIGSALAFLAILYLFDSRRELKGKHANAVVNTLCFTLTALVGYITRPMTVE